MLRSALSRENFISSRVSLLLAGRSAATLAVSRFSQDDPKRGAMAADRPFVFLHGLFGSSNNFRTLGRTLGINTRRHVFAMDLRNHGASTWVEGMDYRDMADDVIQTIETTICAHDVTLIGHSMGGKVAMMVALKRPDLVRKLAVVDIAPVSYPVMRQARGVAEAMAAVPLHGDGALLSRQDVDVFLRKMVTDDNIRRFVLTNLIIEPNSTNGKPQGRWRLNLAELLKHMGQLAKFDVPGGVFESPSLFVYGSKSDYIVDTSHEVISRYFPNYQLKGIDAGHWVHAEKPAEFLQVITDFDGE